MSSNHSLGQTGREKVQPVNQCLLVENRYYKLVEVECVSGRGLCLGVFKAAVTCTDNYPSLAHIVGGLRKRRVEDW